MPIIIERNSLLLPEGIRLEFPGSGGGSWEPGPRIATNRYFLGNDPSRWIPEVAVYETLRWRELYPGIDLVLHVRSGEFEYDFAVAPGADPKQIRIRFRGGSAEIVPGGSIRIRGVVEQRPPAVFQGDHRIPGRFVRRGDGELGLELGSYDRRQPLLIDPVLVSMNYHGGEDDDEVVAVGPHRMRGSDGAFAAGNTRSVGLGGIRRRSQDCFISLLDSTGGVMETIFFGGGDSDELRSVVWSDTFFSFVVGGTTSSRDFSFSSGQPPRPYRGGPSDGFWALVGPLGSVAGDYVGGSGADRVAAVGLDGRVIVVGGDTASRDLPAREAWQADLAGGTDLMIAAFRDGVLLFSTYLGGRDDETMLAGAAGLFFGGETRSTDFPVTAGPRRGIAGLSDGFLLQLRLSLFDGARLAYDRETWVVGGSGTDRVESLHLPTTFRPTTVAIAGTTRSPDLPTINAWQPSSGGQADAFAGRFTFADGTWQTLTYHGGRGDDEARALWSDPDGRIHLTGVTRSLDLPTKAPLQPALSGPSDAFYLFLDRNGDPLHATYLGGAGDDSGLAIASATTARLPGSVRIGGASTSPAPHPGLEARNGFSAVIENGVLLAPDRLVMGKDTATLVFLGGLPARATVRSSHPDLVRPVANGVPATEVTVEQQTSAVTLEAYADQGEAEVVVSAPGLASRTIKVTLRPTYLRISLPELAHVGGSPISLSAALAMVNPETMAVEGVAGGLRTGLGPTRFEWTVSDSAILQVNNSAVPEPTATPIGPGTAEVSIVNPRFPLLETGSNRRVRVLRPAFDSFNNAVAGHDVLRSLSYGFRLPETGTRIGSQVRGPVTFRSHDPARLVLRVSPTSPAADSITLESLPGRFLPDIWVQGRTGAGNVEVSVTGPNVEPGTASVALAPARLSLNEGRPLVAAAPNSSRVGLGVSVEIEGVNSIPQPTPIPNLTLRLTSTDPAIVQPVMETQPLDGRLVELRIAGRGEAEIRAEVIGASIAPATVRVSVIDPQPVPRLITFGRPGYVTGFNLVTEAEAFVTGANPADPVTVRVANPSIVRLSRGTETGAAELRFIPNDGAVRFGLEGVASSGTTEITVESPDNTTGRTTVTALPSGIAWTRSQLALETNGRWSASVAAFPLDDVTGEPVGFAGTLRSGLSVPVTIDVLGDLAVTPTTLTLGSGGAGSVDIRAGRPGSSTLRLRTPPGGPVGIAPRRETLRVDVGVSPIRAQAFTLGRDQLLAYSFQADGNAIFTVTSLDPERLLVSGDPAAPGQRSVAVPSKVVYLHALAGAGTARISISADGYASAEAEMTLTPIALRLILRDGSIEPAGLRLRFPSDALVARVWMTNGRDLIHLPLRPGAAPLEVQLASSNPDVFTVTPSTILLTPGQPPAEFRVQPLSSGQAELRMTAPAGVEVTPAIPITVERSGVTLGRWSLGAQMQTRVALSLTEGSIAPREAVSLTVTSSDPARLLLSGSPTAPGAATLNIAWGPGNAQSFPFYIQSVGSDEAEVGVSIRSDVFGEGSGSVLIRRSWFEFENGQPVSVNRGNSLVLNIQPAHAFEPGTQVGPVALRPGMASLLVAVASSDPDIAAAPEGGALFSGGDARKPVTVAARASGRARLSIQPPPGFGSGSMRQSVELTVLGAPPVTVSCVNTVAKDSQMNCSTSPGATITVDDPTRLQLSETPASPLVPRLTSRFGSFFVNALSDSGTATITVEAAEASPVRHVIRLLPSALTLPATAMTLNLSPTPLPAFLGLNLVGLDGANMFPVIPRSGLSIPLQFTSSAPGVARVEPASATYTQSGLNATPVRIIPVSPGTATITVSVPAGFTSPRNGSVAVTVR